MTAMTSWLTYRDLEEGERRHGTPIQWTHIPGYKGETWNPVWGCSHVSEGCRNCYAEGVDRRFGARIAGRPFKEWTAPNAAEVVTLLPERLEDPLHWSKPRAVFVNSLSDLFHEQVPDEFIDRVFATMAISPAHIFMILTKRPERMRSYLSTDPELLEARWRAALPRETAWPMYDHLRRRDGWPLPNVWLGVSAERQQEADERNPILLDTPAAVRFVSYEPALGPIDFVDPDPTDHGKGPIGEWDWLGHTYEPTGEVYPPFGNQACARCHNFEGFPLHRGGLTPFLDWLIVGGESGPQARPFDLGWARSAVQQAHAAGLPAFVKQLGAMPMTNAVSATRLRVPLRDSHGGDWFEWAVDLRVREFPIREGA